MKFPQRLMDWFSHLPQLTLVEAKGVIVPSYATTVGEKPETAFSKLRDYYLTDPSVKSAIDYLTGQVVGPGFYLTSEDDRAKTLVEEFFKVNGFELLLENIAREVLYAGNSFVQMIEPDNLKELHHLQLSSIVRVERDKVGLPQRLVLRVGGQETELQAQEVIHFAWNVVDRQSLGTGLLSPLARTRFDTNGKKIPSFLDAKAQIEHDLMRVIHRYPPRNVYQFEDVSDQFIEEKVKPILKDPDIEDFAVNKKLTVHDITVSSRAEMLEYINYIFNQVIAGLETPVIRLFTTPGFTEASANVAAEIAERMVLTVQRFFKKTIEGKIILRLLEQAGINPVTSSIQLNWGQPNIPEVSLDHLAKFVELGVVKPVEARKILQQTAGWELEATEQQFDDAPTKPPRGIPVPETERRLSR